MCFSKPCHRESSKAEAGCEQVGGAFLACVYACKVISICIGVYLPGRRRMLKIDCNVCKCVACQVHPEISSSCFECQLGG